MYDDLDSYDLDITFSDSYDIRNYLYIGDFESIEIDPYRYNHNGEKNEFELKILELTVYFDEYDKKYEFKKYNHGTYSPEDTRSFSLTRKQFYPMIKNWHKIRPHLHDPYVKGVLAHDFNKYTTGCWGERFRVGDFPARFEDCPWSWYVPGMYLDYYHYVKHQAAHWLVNFNLVLAMRAEPKRKWRILKSDFHSTVWDGELTLFDFNGLAFFENAGHCFRAATSGNGIELAPGEFIKTDLYRDKPLQITGLRVKPLRPLPRRIWVSAYDEVREIRWLQGEHWFLIHDMCTGSTGFVPPDTFATELCAHSPLFGG